MKIWILGRRGLLGQSMIDLCRKRKISYIATSQEQANLTDLKQLMQIGEREEITHIVNCAAYTDVDGAESNLELAYKINSEGPRNLGLVASKIFAKMVHISTDYVFDGRKEEPYLENDLCAPLGVYGHSKWLGENHLLEQFPSSCIIRSSWLFGKGGKNFISSLFNLMKSKEELKVVTNQKGKPTYVHDLSQAILSLLCHSGIFHFANQGDASRYQIAETILAQAKKQQHSVACHRLIPVLSDEFPTPAKRPAYSVLATDKIEKVLGYAPRDWKEVLKDYLNDAV